MLIVMPTTSPRSTHTTDNRCTTIALAMQKGGVGKTTGAINISYEAAQQGLRVLFIDLDQQANGTMGLGIDVTDDDGTAYELLTPARDSRRAIGDIIKKSEFGVDVVPATRDLRAHERNGLGPGGEVRLKAAIESVSDNYDLVVLDCPPALGHLTVSAFGAADDVIAVVSPDGPDELAGLSELGESVFEVQELLNPELDIRHVLLSNYLGQARFAKDVKTTLKRDWPDEYLGEVPRTIRVGEAKARQVPIGVHAPDCTAAEAYRDVTRTLLERIGKK